MTITHADMHNIWPHDELRLCAPTDLVGLGLSPDAEQVLTEVGLPAHIEFFFTAQPPARFQPPQHPGETYCRIGTDEGGDLSITPTGAVEWTSDGTNLTRSVNTSLVAFAETLLHFGQYRQHVGDLPEDEAEPLIHAFADQLRTADPDILTDEDNFWVLVLDQMREGVI